MIWKLGILDIFLACIEVLCLWRKCQYPILCKHLLALGCQKELLLLLHVLQVYEKLLGLLVTLFYPNDCLNTRLTILRFSFLRKEKSALNEWLSMIKQMEGYSEESQVLKFWS
jgi:hypothetical protein